MASAWLLHWAVRRPGGGAVPRKAGDLVLQLPYLLPAGEQPADRWTLPPVKLPPALTTWPSIVTTRLR